MSNKQKENQKEAAKERNIQPFWNDFCKETSKKLWMSYKDSCKVSKPASLNDIPIGKIGSSKIQSKTVRNMLNLGQSQFRNRLKQTAEIYGSHVIEINEAYTSKTCTRCGYIHEKLGGSEVFKCPECGLVISRDINGARNIMLRAMLDQAAMKIA